jgi:hypothetical protein
MSTRLRTIANCLNASMMAQEEILNAQISFHKSQIDRTGEKIERAIKRLEAMQ